MSRPLRVGRIAALNMYPIYHGLERGGAELRFTDGVPTDLNRALLAGDLDVSAVSSVAYARHADRLRLVPVASITADGAVDSIQLFSRVPFDRVRSVHVTPHSATSVVLLRLLLDAGAPPFTMLTRPPEEALDVADAVLLIGDEALAGLRSGLAPHHTDLAAEWHSRTGLPMVFAVWAARADTADSRPDEIARLEALIRRALDDWRDDPERVVRDAAARFPFPEDFIRGYLAKLSYGFGGAERSGLECFLSRAAAAGLIAAGEGVGSAR